VDARFVNGIAAIVEDRVITADEVKREIRPLVEQIERQSRNRREFEQQMALVQQEVIQSLVDKILLVKEFEKKGMQIPASFIEAQLESELAEQFEGDRARFLAFLRERGITTSDYRREIEDRIKVGYMRGQMFKSQSVVSPVRIEQYYRENKHRFQQDDGVKLRLIRIAQIADESPDVLRQTAETIITQLRGGRRFRRARETAQPGRPRAHRRRLGLGVARIARACSGEHRLRLNKSEFSEPVVLGNDIFILLAEDRRFAGPQPIDEVRPEIERFLSQQLARESQERMLERLRGRYFVRYF
jgi:peptidyl-prolyl cis-trans isomerase SurA